MQDTTNPHLSEALYEWGSILGEGQLMEHPQTLRPTYAVERIVPAVLTPTSAEQVAAVMRIAQRHRVPVYPYSGGRNWGFGSRLPVRDGAVLLDLSRLNRILEYDAELAYVRLEPGVTQQQLSDYLEAQGGKLWLDPTGAGPKGSVIGNALDRGSGLTPYGDHVRHLSDLEVVLATGRTIHTGYSRFAGCSARNLDPRGIGPDLDGLFSQSNLGVVVAATVALMPRPEKVALASIGLDSGDLALVVDRLRKLQLTGTLRGVPSLFNDVQVIQSQPQDPLLGRVRNFHEHRDRLRREASASPWTAAVGLYGREREVALQAEILAAEFNGHRVSVEDVATTTSWANTHRQFLGDLVSGRVTAGPKRAYFHKPRAPADDLDPDRDACGVLWVTPVAPMLGHHVDRVASLCESVIHRWGYEAAIAVFFKRPRIAHFHVSVMFDLEDLHELAGRALRCQDELRRELLGLGYLPHRLGIHEMDLPLGSEPGYGETLHAIKSTLDPGRVLSPGRYETGA